MYNLLILKPFYSKVIQCNLLTELQEYLESEEPNYDCSEFVYGNLKSLKTDDTEYRLVEIEKYKEYSENDIAYNQW